MLNQAAGASRLPKPIQNPPRRTSLAPVVPAGRESSSPPGVNRHAVATRSVSAASKVPAPVSRAPWAITGLRRRPEVTRVSSHLSSSSSQTPPTTSSPVATPLQTPTATTEPNSNFSWPLSSSPISSLSSRLEELHSRGQEVKGTSVGASRIPVLVKHPDGVQSKHASPANTTPTFIKNKNLRIAPGTSSLVCGESEPEADVPKAPLRLPWPSREAVTQNRLSVRVSSTGSPIATSLRHTARIPTLRKLKSEQTLECPTKLLYVAMAKFGGISKPKSTEDLQALLLAEDHTFFKTADAMFNEAEGYDDALDSYRYLTWRMGIVQTHKALLKSKEHLEEMRQMLKEANYRHELLALDVEYAKKVLTENPTQTLRRVMRKAAEFSGRN